MPIGFPSLDILGSQLQKIFMMCPCKVYSTILLKNKVNEVIIDDVSTMHHSMRAMLLEAKANYI